jgi:hypothetical protein
LIDQGGLDLDAVAARRLLDHAVEAKGLHRAQIERTGFEAAKAAMRLQLRKAVGAHRAGHQPLAGGRRQRGAQIVGEDVAALAVGARDLLGLVDADQDGGARRAGGGAQPEPLGFKRRLEHLDAFGSRLAVVVARRVHPGLLQAVADHSARLDLAEIGEAARDRIGEIEQRIGTRTEGAQRKPGRPFAAQPRDHPGLE